jgi:hypothetical protein
MQMQQTVHTNHLLEQARQTFKLNFLARVTCKANRISLECVYRYKSAKDILPIRTSWHGAANSLFLSLPRGVILMFTKRLSAFFSMEKLLLLRLFCLYLDMSVPRRTAGVCAWAGAAFDGL